MSNRPFDRGQAAARRGDSIKSNPFNHPDQQKGSSMNWERKASEWDEGWNNVPVDERGLCRKKVTSRYN
jgi:hypothetical protein